MKVIYIYLSAGKSTAVAIQTCVCMTLRNRFRAILNDAILKFGHQAKGEV